MEVFRGIGLATCLLIIRESVAQEFQAKQSAERLDTYVIGNKRSIHFHLKTAVAPLQFQLQKERGARRAPLFD
jgi:hypothetical protein